MEILLPTAEKQNDIHNIVTNTYNQVRDLNASSSGGLYTAISHDNAKGIHEGTADRKLMYSIEGKGFAEKFLFRINTSGLYEVVVDGVVKQNIKLGSNVPVGFLQAEDRKVVNGKGAFFYGENTYYFSSALLSYPHDVVNTTAYESVSVSEVSPIVFDKSFEVYFTPNEKANGFYYSFDSAFRGGVY